MIKTKNLYSSFFIIFVFAFSLPSFAFYTTQESAEVTKPGTYKIGGEPQVMLAGGSGLNLSAFVDRGLTDSTSVRGYLGFGDIDFVAGVSYKWIPYPDYQNQPAMGLKVEGLYGREGNNNIFGVKLHPLISKKFDTDAGLFIPYGSIPIGTVSIGSKNDFTVQLVGGTEFISPKLERWHFGAELGVNASNSVGYIASYVEYLLDEPTHSAVRREHVDAAPEKPVKKTGKKKR